MAQCICVRGAHIRDGEGHSSGNCIPETRSLGESYFDSNHNAGLHRLLSPESNSKHEALSTCQEKSYATQPYQPILLDKEALPRCTYTSTDVHISSTSIREPKATQQHPCQIKKENNSSHLGIEYAKANTLRRHGS